MISERGRITWFKFSLNAILQMKLMMFYQLHMDKINLAELSVFSIFTLTVLRGKTWFLKGFKSEKVLANLIIYLFKGRKEILNFFLINL